jgi:hypothetical protein
MNKVKKHQISLIDEKYYKSNLKYTYFMATNIDHIRKLLYY